MEIIYLKIYRLLFQINDPLGKPTRLDQDIKIKPHRRPHADIVGKTLIKEIFLLPWLNDAGRGLQPRPKRLKTSIVF